MYGLPDTVLELLQNFFLAHPQILKVLLYGSRAMGQEKPGSDIDLALITSSEEDISHSIQMELDELPTPYLFDVIDYSKISNASLRGHIDRVGKILFQK